MKTLKKRGVLLSASLAAVVITMGCANSVGTGDAKSIMVYKHDGTLQCGEGKEVTLKEMAKQLTDAGVIIIAQKKSTDGFMHPAVCGGITGQINLYEIPAQSVATAQGLGFKVLALGAVPK